MTRSLTILTTIFLGCGPLDGVDPDGDVGVAPDAGGADSGESGSDRPAFPELATLDTTADPTCTETWLAAVTGRIVDEAGAPLGGGRPQLCLTRSDGSFLCTEPPTARADGWYVQVVGEGNRCVSNVALRALLPGAGLATTYCHVELRTEGGVYHREEPIVLYSLEAPVTLPPVGDDGMPRDVTLDDGLVIGEVLPDEFFGDYDRIAGRRVTTTPCFAEGADLDGLYALGPEGYPSENGYSVRIPNPTGLMEGAVVDLLVLGGLNTRLVGGAAVEEADLDVFGSGTVRDGVIVSDPGTRLPELTWLGYRAR